MDLIKQDVSAWRLVAVAGRNCLAEFDSLVSV